MLCAAKKTPIEKAAGGKPWATGHFETYAQYLSGGPFFNYALEYVERHLQQCGQAAGDLGLLSQLCKRLTDGPAAYRLENWIPRAWGQQIPSHEQQDYSRNFRAGLLHAATRMENPRAVEALSIAGAEVDAYLDGKTPSMVTAERGDLTTVQVLLERGSFVGANDGRWTNGAASRSHEWTFQNGDGRVSGIAMN